MVAHLPLVAPAAWGVPAVFAGRRRIEVLDIGVLNSDEHVGGLSFWRDVPLHRGAPAAAAAFARASEVLGKHHCIVPRH